MVGKGDFENLYPKEEGASWEMGICVKVVAASEVGGV